ncbi:2-dehydro-3-deoxy-6-phosphogalactonate aldolase [Burkholderiaceae bacterium FT117]|uniref:2-dehydro-3-deoxy-6-phosphogalactonate aldolase n=1 Tax=Zeimonas sediminis TaxID=2944268 RepID=UPI002342C542|nr:2-dehydro-3-deoxy-6-phosphogalactonate aldolase [Zeimonas sediminis]MCM5569834.1 2-dehydro-3-deoxy-6-phosphogalactonate aldolase [Zeimonas sediminis]
MTTADHPQLRDALEALPLVAILRGLTPAEAPAIGDALREAGFRLIEVPLNSPEPLASIRLLAERLPDCVVGAGTVLRAAEVRAVREAGGGLIVSPNFDPEVVEESVALELPSVPGVATPSEAFAAIKAGAAALKAFPAEGIPPEVLKAWRAVIPASVPILPVGGIVPEKLAAYRVAGASGFGLGSALYRPGDDARAVGERARRFVAAWDAANGRFTA